MHLSPHAVACATHAQDRSAGQTMGTQNGEEKRMFMILSLVLFVIGLGLVISFAEQLVKGVLGTSIGFGISPFLVSVIFIGFDLKILRWERLGRLKGSRALRSVLLLARQWLPLPSLLASRGAS